jgi:hypothetical protein
VEVPSKRTRGGIGESHPVGSKKRKAEDQEASPLKRVRVDDGESDLEGSKNARPASPAHRQGRGRESTRVKEFPAGNITTSASRISFLQSLCNIPKFLKLVDLVPAVVSQSLFWNIIYL